MDRRKMVVEEPRNRICQWMDHRPAECHKVRRIYKEYI